MKTKHLIFYCLALLLPATLNAQWQTSGSNIYYNNGNVGIGTNSPLGRLHILADSKHYFINRTIPGSSDDAISTNYIILHKMYNGSAIDDHYVIGKIVAERGGTGSWNRKWTIEVNTSSAYITNRGSIISYNEYARLVTLQYGGAKYLAAEITKESTMYCFSFTGYARNETLRLVKANEVSNIQTFADKDPISLNNGDLFVGTNVGIGTTNPTSKLTVAGDIRAREVKVEATAGADFVFAPDYRLRPLTEVEQFITANKHLPDIAPADSMVQNGVNVSEMQIRLLQKVEELTLYVIEQEKRNIRLEQQVQAQQKEIEQLKKVADVSAPLCCARHLITN